MNDQLGEVIASDTRVLEVECHTLYGAPHFGSFVRAHCVGSERHYLAVVTGITTGPLDGNRVVQAHRLPPGELEQRKPHLKTLLRTTFQARLIGYGNADGRLAATPPAPPHLHCYVYPAEAEAVRDITRSPNFLRPLVDTPDVPMEDLLVATIGAAQQAWGEDAGVQLLIWGKYLARLLHRDYVTLEGVLQRIAPAPLPAVVIPPAATPRANGGPGRPWESPLPIAGNGTSRSDDPFED